MQGFYPGIIEAILSDSQTIDLLLLKFSYLKRHLNEQRNYFSPAVTLPPELLVHIFQTVLRLENNGKSLKSCSQVCRRWRYAAAESTLLWANALDFVGDSYSWVTEMLRRSLSTPYDLCVDYDQVDHRDPTDVKVSYALHSLSCIHRLHLNASQASFTAIFRNGGIRTAAPILNSMYLTNTSRIYGESGTPLLPSTILSLDAPLLRSLHIAGFAFTWSHLKFNNLTCLSILELPDLTKPTIEHVLRFLVDSPLLQELRLGGVFFEPSEDEPETPLIVTLDYLSRLDLWASVSTSTAFLTQLALPSLSALNVVV
ncbi:hypothetical protein BJ138DRAFT_1017417, partial [Hygrophoropsis aurantiaca]